MFRNKYLANIFLLSTLFAVLLPLLNLFYISPSYRNLLTEETEGEAVRHARYLVRTLGLEGAPFERNTIPPEIAEDVGVLQGDVLLVKLRVFSAGGEVVFSTSAEEVGTVNRKPYFREVVAAGKVYSKVVRKDFPTAEGESSTADIVETYIPNMVEGGFGGAIETYYDITASRAKILSLTRISTAWLLSAAFGSWLIIVLVLKKAKRSVEEREAAEGRLQEAKVELEVRVAKRTLQLTEKVAEKVEAEKSLRTALGQSEEAKEKIDAILASVADALLVVDSERSVVLMNDAAESLLGLPSGEVLGEPMEKAILDEALRTRIEAELEAPSAGGQFEFEMAGSSDSRFFKARLSPIRGEAGTVILMDEVTREREIDRMKSEFIARATHELQTPLAAIMGFAELLSDAEEGAFSLEQQREFLSYIQERSEALSGIIDDLLDLSRVERGKALGLDLGSCPIWGLLRGILAGHGEGEGGHRFELVLPEEDVELLLDAGRMTQVFENILSNAVKYSPEGGSIRVAGELADGCCRISVRDEGIGMTEEQASRAFDRFYRADGSDTALSGTGLGLSIARHILEAHGGTIEVQSELGRGTEVLVAFPADLTPTGVAAFDASSSGTAA